MKTRIISRIIQAAFVRAGWIACLAAICQRAARQAAAPIGLGVIGFDTSHVLRFTELLNDPSNPDHVAGARVVAAFKGGSPDMEQSATRIERFTAEVRDKWKVELVGSIEELCQKVDG